MTAVCDDPNCDGRHECHACGGDGYVLDDCFEDSCCCADPATEHDIIACDLCNGAGGWRCPALAAEAASRRG